MLGLKVSYRGVPVVQWLRLSTSNAGAAGSIPGQGTKIPHAAQRKDYNRVFVLQSFPLSVVLLWVNA